MEKRIALLQNGIVFNIIVGTTVEEMATLFNCEAIEVTEETGQAFIDYGFADGVFLQPPFVETPPPPVEEQQEL